MKTRYLLASLQISLLLFGCSAPTDLKSNCMKAAKIVKEANKRLQTTKTEDVIKDGVTVAVRYYTDNSKSKKYLKVKKKALQKSYDIIKSYYLGKGNDSFDALCAMAVLNQYKIYLDGEPVEERCKYTMLVIEKKPKKVPSEWFLNEFFFYISRPPGFHDSNWAKMNSQEKFQDMIKSLLIPGENGKTCLDSES